MTVRLEAENGVAILTIDRPERRNAIDLPTAEALDAALSELDARDDLVVGVIHGNGPVFSAGMDLKVIAAGGPRPIVPGRGAFGIVEKPPAKPLIAAVEGAALDLVVPCTVSTRMFGAGAGKAISPAPRAATLATHSTVTVFPLSVSR